MTKLDEIKSIIVNYLKSATNYEIADIYVDLIGCGDCPYWHDCRNEHDCDAYILDKLAEDKEDRK